MLAATFGLSQAMSAGIELASGNPTYVMTGFLTAPDDRVLELESGPRIYQLKRAEILQNNPLRKPAKVSTQEVTIKVKASDILSLKYQKNSNLRGNK